MNRPSRLLRLGGTALAALALLVPSLAFTGAPPAERFSRSRWLAANAGRYRFDGGILPAQREPILDFLRRTAALPLGGLAGKRAAPPERSTRVSLDLLSPVEEPGQEETQAETTLAINPANPKHLLAGYQEGRVASGGARALTAAVSLNNGLRWSETLIPGLTRATGGVWEKASDPWVAFGPDGRAYFAAIAFHELSSANGVFVSASPDGGRTWDPPVAVHTNDVGVNTPNSSGRFDDKEAVIVDTRKESRFFGRIYVAWDTAGGGRQVLRVASSDDGGRSFTPPVDVDAQGFNVAVTPLVGPGGVLHLVWGKDPGGPAPSFSVWTARSEDGGRSWSAPHRIAEDLAVGVDGQRTGDVIPVAAIDASSGTLYAAWQDSRFTPGVDQIVLSRSLDEGASWSAPVRISDGPANAPAFTPAIAVDPAGRVGVCYASLRNDPSRTVLVDQYCTSSKDRGVSFARGRRVNSASWDVRRAAITDRGFFLGDYQGMVAGPRGFQTLFVATLKPSRRDPSQTQPDAFSRLMPQ